MHERISLLSCRSKLANADFIAMVRVLVLYHALRLTTVLRKVSYLIFGVAKSICSLPLAFAALKNLVVSQKANVGSVTVFTRGNHHPHALNSTLAQAVHEQFVVALRLLGGKLGTDGWSAPVYPRFIRPKFIPASACGFDTESASKIGSMLEHVSPELVLNALRFLLEGYKVARDRFKDSKTPDRVEDIVTRAESSPGTDAKQIEQSIAQTLNPDDAAIVRSDLELLSLFVFPVPSLDAFDYWGKLTKLVASLRDYARRNRLFELRGEERSGLGQMLWLFKTSKSILPKEFARELGIPGNMQTVKSAECGALLQNADGEFPIKVIVAVHFNQYSSMGGEPGVRTVEARYGVVAGQQRHWLRFNREAFEYQLRENTEYRLDAEDLIEIVESLRDDIKQYAKEVQADERKIEPLFSAIETFAGKRING